MNKKRLVVIGGGAAGFFCAIHAALLNPRLQVTILEKSSKTLSKVRISGGGRCNVTHACDSVSAMIKNYPRGQNFLKRSFRHFFVADTIRWFGEREVQLKPEADGRMFPVTDSSESIAGCLESEARRLGVEVRLRYHVLAVYAEDGPHGRFRLEIRDMQDVYADVLCIAAGGFPKPAQYDWIRKLGHSVSTPVPSLFTFNIPQNQRLKELMGISVEKAAVRIQKTSFQYEGPVLITHWGLSGPAVLKLSAFAARELAEMQYRFTISINWLPQTHENALLEQLRSIRHQRSRQKIALKNPFHLPARLWEYILEQSDIDPGWNWADMPGKQQNRLAKQLSAQEFQVMGKTTFKEEFVTAGGVDLSEVSSATMQSRIVPGLFFAGEILDVDGITGGFNFQHAWTSGYIAGSSVTKAEQA